MGSAKSKITAQPEGKPRYYYRDNFFLSTDKSHLCPHAVNDVFGSSLMWWNNALEIKEMRKMLQNCLTFGIYEVSETAAHMKKHGPPMRRAGDDMKLVGFARLVTDYVTMAYLTDVFVLEEHQGRGLARWMMEGIKDTVDSWPNLRGLLLMTHGKSAAKMYEQTLGAVEFDKGPSKGLVLLEMAGQAEKGCPLDH